YESTFPHIALYRNQTLDAVQNRSLVVQPLVGKEQTFDIAVSVWQKRYATGDAIRVDSSGKWPMKFKGDLYMELDEDWLYTYNCLDERERVVYSDIVFRGLRLQDKEVHARLNFQVDLKPFRDSYVSWTDLRASFVLIASSPSLMDHFQSYNQTSSIDRGFDATRFWFPLGSTDTRNRTDAELGLESFVVSIPLIKSREVQSKCPSARKADDEDDILGWRLSSDDPSRLLKQHPL
ncbi:hypothetical protein C8J56DRAFT_800926, partial [Mycena floridula]